MLNCFGFQCFSSQSLFWSVLVNRRKQKRSSPAWLWALLPLLLAAALVTEAAGQQPFFGDEPDSLYSAGINNAGPRNAGFTSEVWELHRQQRPASSDYQAQGWSKLLFIWGLATDRRLERTDCHPVLVPLLRHAGARLGLPRRP